MTSGEMKSRFSKAYMAAIHAHVKEDGDAFFDALHLMDRLFMNMCHAADNMAFEYARDTMPKGTGDTELEAAGDAILDEHTEGICRILPVDTAA